MCFYDEENNQHNEETNQQNDDLLLEFYMKYLDLLDQTKKYAQVVYSSINSILTEREDEINDIQNNILSSIIRDSCVLIRFCEIKYNNAEDLDSYESIENCIKDLSSRYEKFKNLRKQKIAQITH